MRRTLLFAGRTTKEILRDPLTLFFGLGFPLILLLLLTAIQSNIPVSLFELDSLTPGITVFGLSFMTLFSALLISKDRSGAFLTRLYTTPLSASGFILGYTLPMLPISLAQGLICYIAAGILGLKPSIGILLALIFILPISLFYIALGLLFGSLLNDKQVGGICGALLTNLSAWLSGIWFDLEMVGGVFEKIANLLPFIHAVELSRAAYACDFGGLLPHLIWVLGYTVVLSLLAVLVFTRKMKKC
ncbi:MAG: ABC transporter permease [Eubacteriales bacterium]